MPSTLLGYLRKSNDDKEEHGEYEIHAGEEIFIGRDSRSCRIVLNDVKISNRHLRIYSVIYDLNADDIEPFVYAEDLSTNGSKWLSKRKSSRKPFPMGMGNAFLLSDGDEILLSDDTSFVFVSSSSTQKSNKIQELEKDSFDNLYEITDRKLGAGGTGEVFMAIDIWTRCQVACKIVNLINPPDTIVGEHQSDIVLNKGRQSRLWREVELLKHISHPNIITVKRVFHSEHNLYIIEDLVTGGDLVSYIEHKGGSIREPDACLIVYQLLQAVRYLHDEHIVHRDIKPENILMSPSAAGVRVILTDFGAATREVGRGCRPRRMKTLCGTLEFVAPEVGGDNKRVNQAGYTKAVDVWSVGCVTTALLAGKSYFINTQDSEYRRNSSAAIIKAAAECNLDRLEDSSAWLDVNHNAKDFVKKLLVLDEKARLTARQALGHSWFTEDPKQKDLETTYKEIVAGWKRWSPGWDFAEHLDRFIEARIPQTDPRRRLLSAQRKEMLTKPSHQIHAGLPAQLGTSDIQDISCWDDIGVKAPSSQPPSPSALLEESPRSTNHRYNKKRRQSGSFNVNKLNACAEPENHCRPRNPLIERNLSPDRGNRISSHYFPDALEISSTSANTASQNKSNDLGNADTTKRRRTIIFDYEEATIYADAGRENRGFVSAKIYSQIVAKKRGERGK